jgi:hypothetical protein
MKVSIDRIGMDLQEASDLYGTQAGGIEQDCSGPSALARSKRTFKYLVKSPLPVARG